MVIISSEKSITGGVTLFDEISANRSLLYLAHIAHLFHVPHGTKIDNAMQHLFVKSKNQ